MSKRIFKRYMVFKWYDYEAGGGLNDCDESFNKKKDAVEYAKKEQHSDEIEIFDRVKGVEIEWKKES